MDKSKTYILAFNDKLYYTKSQLEKEYIERIIKKEVELGNLHDYEEDLANSVMNILNEINNEGKQL